MENEEDKEIRSDARGEKDATDRTCKRYFTNYTHTKKNEDEPSLLVQKGNVAHLFQIQPFQGYIEGAERHMPRRAKKEIKNGERDRNLL